MKPSRLERKPSKLLVIACLAAICLGLVAEVPGSWTLIGATVVGRHLAEAGELEDAQAELERIQRLIEQKQAEFQRLESQRKSVLKDLDRIEQELEGLQSDLADLRRQLNQTETNIAAAQAEIADAQVRLDERNGLMLTRMRAMSEVGYVHYLEVVLGARSFADFLGRFELLRQVLACDVALFREVREEKRQLEAKKAYLEEQREDLVELRSDTTARKAAVEQKQEAKGALLSRLENDQGTIAEALDELERLSKELEKYILQIQLAMQRDGVRPTFHWPVSGPITSRFGMRYHPILHVYKEHTGIDIAAPRNTAVVAAAPGYVILAGWIGGYGKCVVLDHGGYWSTLYAHFDSISVAINDQVPGGGIIGRVGSTGYSTGPHLHFEIRFRGVPQDPLGPGLLPAR